MHRLTRYFSLVFPLLVFATGCSIATDPSETSREQQPQTGLDESQKGLINGSFAQVSAYPWIARFAGCTGAKVGPKTFLTAGHCVLPLERQGVKTVTISDYADRSHELTLVRIHIHCSYRSYCDANDCSVGIAFRSQSADVGIITVAEETPEIAILPIHFGPRTAEEKIYVLGYGCQDNYFDHTGSGALKISPTSIENTIAGYFVTPGPEEDLTAKTAASLAANGIPEKPEGIPGLCPGDSGGPFLSYDPQRQEYSAVGVNSNVDFDTSNGVPTANYHTMISEESNYEVDAWVEDILSGAAEPSCQMTPLPRLEPLPDDEEIAPADENGTSGGVASWNPFKKCGAVTGQTTTFAHFSLLLTALFLLAFRRHSR